MTRFTVNSLVGALLSVSILSAQTPNPEVVKAAQQFADCVSTKDAACMERILTDDFVMVPQSAKFWDKAMFVEELKAGRFGRGHLDLAVASDLRVRMFSSTAIVTFAVSAAQTSPRQYYTTVWVKGSAGQWQLASYHSSLDRNTVAAAKK